MCKSREKVFAFDVFVFFYTGSNPMELFRIYQQCRTWSDSADALAGLALYWWPMSIEITYGTERVKLMVMKKTRSL